VDTVKRYVKLGLDEGASLRCGRDHPAGLAHGLDATAFYLPTILEGDNSMRVAREEIFGPVLCVIKVRSEEDAIKVANDSTYWAAGFGLRTSSDHRVAAAMRTGMVWINDYHQITPGQPLGGFEQSGVGRELSEIGFSEYRVKHIWQNTATDRSGYAYLAMLSPSI
jgi:acyl-CoA reductase-like NAD-dependent aldehyde dehydrogenase